MRVFMIVVAGVMAASPAPALAQPPDSPRIELGAAVSRQVDGEGVTAWSPRITLNLTPSTALEATADVRPRRQTSYGAQISGQSYGAHWRQTLFTSDRWQVFGALGAGAGRLVQVVADGPGAYTYVDSGVSVHLGPGVLFQATRWLALRGDVRLTVGHDSGLRGMVGGVVPLKRFRAGPRAPSDSLKNGIIIGGISGAATGAALFGWAVWSLCESDSCSSSAGVAAVLGGASGAAVGGLIGAMVDALIPGKQALTGTARGKSLQLTIGWH